ncbi:Ankyrin repeat-containing protein [Morus notabilis]|uniref:Ankyrin repeat-containing protein n=2 Tax=Morus notabilis TaxID=981085 RepID=W9S5L0_9ROSA|nr:Ankyrin repeat-containing protein [Morus notabilis]
MKAAAERGDIDMLYSLIREDPHVLDRIDDTPFVDTPLHIAASLGHAKFATEAMLLKSSLARKLNQDGFTPLHLATLQGQTKMVDRLLDIDSDLVRVHGKEGKTPLHYAAERGNMGLVKIFLFYCPSSIQDVTNLSETVLHIAVESRKFDVFSLLVFQVRTSLMKGSQKTEYNILNWGNDVGDTALHIAVKTHQPEVVRVLIDSNVGLDVKNSDGFTALKILELGDSQVNNGEAREVMKEMLRCARASKTSSCVWWKSSKPSSPPTISTSLTNATEHLNTIEGACNVSAPPTSSTTSAVNHELDIALEGQPEGNNGRIAKSLPPLTINLLERWYIDIKRVSNDVSEESRSMILVALVLFATVEYQIVLSPPGGLWQEDNNNSTATHDKKIHPPGTVVMGNLSFLFFMLLNSLALAITTHGIVLLLLELESRWWTINRILMNTLTFLCYLISLQTISPNNSLFALIIVIPATVFILLPYTHDWITQRLENRTRKWYRDEEQCNGY